MLQKARGHMRGQQFASESRSNTSASQQKEAKQEDDEDDIAVSHTRQTFREGTLKWYLYPKIFFDM